MSVPYNTVWDFIVHNISFSLLVVIVVICAFLKMFFKVKKREVSPFGWIFTKIGNSFTKEVKTDIASLKESTNKQLNEIKTDMVENLNHDHYAKIDSIREEMLGYRKETVNSIKELKEDLDSFEKRTNDNINQMRDGTNENCRILKQELNNVKKSNDIQTIRQIRTHILDFANSRRNGRRHSQEEYRSVFDENSEYETIVSKYTDIKNDYYTESFKYIKRMYQEDMDNNNFLA